MTARSTKRSSPRARFFMERTLPETSSLLSKLTSGKDNLMALDAAAF